VPETTTPNTTPTQKILVHKQQQQKAEGRRQRKTKEQQTTQNSNGNDTPRMRQPKVPAFAFAKQCLPATFARFRPAANTGAFTKRSKAQQQQRPQFQNSPAIHHDRCPMRFQEPQLPFFVFVFVLCCVERLFCCFVVLLLGCET
jgi:hypothetical protein